MKHLLLCLLMLLTVSTCHVKTDSWETINEGASMISIDDTLNSRQLDSLIIADTLSGDFDNAWLKSVVLSEEKQQLVKYVYIKSDSLLYTLSQYNDTLYIVNKRTTK